MLHIYIHLHVSLTTTKGRRLGPHKKQYSFENRGALDIKVVLGGGGGFEDVPRVGGLTALPLTEEAQVPSQSSTCNIYGGHSGVGKGFCRNSVLPLVSIIPPTLHIHLHLMLLNQKDKRAKNRKFHIVQRPFAHRWALDTKVRSHIFFSPLKLRPFRPSSLREAAAPSSFGTLTRLRGWTTADRSLILGEADSALHSA